MQSVQVGAISTTETALLGAAQLQLVGYKCRDDGTLAYLQLFNNGDRAINVAQWEIAIDGRAIALRQINPGVLVPKTHVVAAESGVVSGASFEFETVHYCRAKSAVIVRDAVSRSDYELAVGQKARSVSSTGTSYNQAFSDTTNATIFDDQMYVAPPAPHVTISEIYPYASDCSPFDRSILCGDFVELYNPGADTIWLDDIVLRADSGSSTRTNSNTITLDGIELRAGEYRAVSLTDTSQRINLTNSGGYVWLEDKWDTMAYTATLTRYEVAGSKQQGLSWLTQNSVWTNTPTPSTANIFTATTIVEEESSLGACPAGKYRNPETNRCRTIEEAVNALAACPEGQMRNPATNRCRSIASSASTLTPCKEGQERNPATNRCRSIASAVAELLPCDEGSERNPATNRCRKIQDAAIPAAAFPVEPVKDAASAAIAWWAVGGLLILGAGYGVWEWRHEIMGGMRKIIARGRE